MSSDPSASPVVTTSRAPRRWLRLLVLAVGGPILLILTALLVVGFAVNLGPTVRKQIVANLPEVKKKLGREVEIGTVSLRLLPKLRLRISDVKVLGQPGQTGVLAEPLLQIGNIEAELKVFPALFSLGRRIVVSKIEISDGKVQVARLSGGRLSYEDVLDQLASQPKDDTPLSQATIDRLAGLFGEKS